MSSLGPSPNDQEDGARAGHERGEVDRPVVGEVRQQRWAARAPARGRSRGRRRCCAGPAPGPPRAARRWRRRRRARRGTSRRRPAGNPTSGRNAQTTTLAAATSSTPSSVAVATMTPVRAASRTPRRGVHCRVGTMAPVPWSAVLVTTDSARIPKSANIAVGWPPSQAVASGGAPEGSLAMSYPMSAPMPTTATVVTRARIQLERTLQIRLHSALPVRARTVVMLIGLLRSRSARGCGRGSRRCPR